MILQPEGDPIIDRMKSFETRSLIEPRKKVMYVVHLFVYFLSFLFLDLFW